MANPKQKQKPLPRPETSYTVDPLSDLVSATELRVWRNHPTTAKVMRYLTRYRSQMVEAMAEGSTTTPDCDATAMLTAECVSKAVLLKEITTLEAKDIAHFYDLGEPKDEEKK